MLLNNIQLNDPRFCGILQSKTLMIYVNLLNRIKQRTVLVEYIVIIK
jgi:hypothetical protein